MTGQAERRQNGTAMAEILLFHHALGLTAGVRAFAGRLRAAGHGVHLPDLYDGRTFTRLDEGVGHAEAYHSAGFPDDLPLVFSVHSILHQGVICITLWMAAER
jgi:dienelactone hydrolase